MDFEHAKWLLGVILLPLAKKACEWWRRRRIRRQREEALIRRLVRLPPELKAVLAEYYRNCTDTLCLDPYDAAVAELTRRGFLLPGDGCGAYHAVKRYMSVPHEVGELMDVWALRDPSFFQLVLQVSDLE